MASKRRIVPKSLMTENDHNAPADRRSSEHAFDELRELNIRHVAQERRALIRSRGYWITFALACGICAVQAFNTGGQTVALWATPVLVYLAWRAWRRARFLSSQLRQSALPHPELPPSFAGLSDGSQQVTNLQRLVDKRPS